MNISKMYVQNLELDGEPTDTLAVFGLTNDYALGLDGEFGKDAFLENHCLKIEDIKPITDERL